MSAMSDDATAYGTQMLELGLRNMTDLSTSAQAIVTQSADYTQSSIEHAARALEKLIEARSVESAVQIQSEFGRAAYETFVAEGTKLGGLYADLARQAYKPFESMVARSR